MSSQYKQKVHFINSATGNPACGNFRKEFMPHWKSTKFIREVTCNNCKKSFVYKNYYKENP